MITIKMMTEFLGWCSILNGAILLISAIFIVVARKIALNIHHTLFNIDNEYLKKSYFQYLAQYKILIIVFNIVPYFALKIIS